MLIFFTEPDCEWGVRVGQGRGIRKAKEATGGTGSATPRGAQGLAGHLRGLILTESTRDPPQDFDQ